MIAIKSCEKNKAKAYVDANAEKCFSKGISSTHISQNTYHAISCEKEMISKWKIKKYFHAFLIQLISFFLFLRARLARNRNELLAGREGSRGKSIL